MHSTVGSRYQPSISIEFSIFPSRGKREEIEELKKVEIGVSISHHRRDFNSKNPFHSRKISAVIVFDGIHARKSLRLHVRKVKGMPPTGKITNVQTGHEWVCKCIMYECWVWSPPFHWQIAFPRPRQVDAFPSYGRLACLERSQYRSIILDALFSSDNVFLYG